MPDQPTQEEFEEIKTAWKQHTDRAGMAEMASDDTVDADDDDGGVPPPEPEEDGTGGGSATGGEAQTGGAGNVEVVVNERAAQNYHNQEEEFQEQLPHDEEGIQVEAVEEGARFHYQAEDHEEVLNAKAALIGEEPGSMWDFFEGDREPPEKMVSDRDDYDRIWIIDIQADEPFGPFSPPKFTIQETITELSQRVDGDVLLETDVFQVE